MNKGSIGKLKSRLNIVDLAGLILAWSVIIVLFCVMPLYHKDGYSMISTLKYKVIMRCGFYALIAASIVFLFKIFDCIIEKKFYLYINKAKETDLFMILFVFLGIISNSCCTVYSDLTNPEVPWFKEGSLYGQKGWYMGLASYLVFFLFYLILSRCISFSRYIFIPVIAVALFTFWWGINNVYTLVPRVTIALPLALGPRGMYLSKLYFALDMKFDYKSAGGFISSMGNINWFCGYTSVVAPIIWGLYIDAKKKWEKAILILSAFISLHMIMVNGSDSGLFALVVTMIALLIFAIGDKEKLLNDLEILAVMFLAGALVGFVDKTEKIPRLYRISVLEKVYGFPSLVMLFIVIAIYVFLKARKGKFNVKAAVIVRNIAMIGIGVSFVLYVILTAVNTVNGGKVPIIGTRPEFIFSDSWGSSRGITWKTGLKGFSLLSGEKKFIGSGPDMFYYSLLQIPNEELQKMIAYFGGQRLTNAHNEWITLLVNNGILGLGAFIALTFTGIKKCLTYAKDHPGLICVALSLISYTANNMFSFATMMNTPLFFAMLGLGMAALRDSEKPSPKNVRSHAAPKKRKAHKH